MEKKTEGMKPLIPTPDPAKKEIEMLKKELADEKIKTNALSRRCILLGKALEALQAVENDRNDTEVINLVNGVYYRREALQDAEKRRRAQEKKAAEAYTKACRHNALALSTSAVISFSAMILGFVGFINGALAAIIAGVALAAFGWALNDCVYLLGRCE